LALVAIKKAVKPEKRKSTKTDKWLYRRCNVSVWYGDLLLFWLCS